MINFIATEYPTQPGCYIMRDARSRVTYVGKAKSLRRRLSTYFQPGLRERKARRMVACVHSIEVILVNNDYESLVLENNLIKRYKPRFNRQLKPATSGYFYIQLTGEAYPRFLRYRKNRYVKAVQGLREPGEGCTFGPYLRSVHRETILEYVNDNFQLRTCKPLGHRLCLRYHLGHCSGVCEQRVSQSTYDDQVAVAVDFLSHSQECLVEQMRQRMLECAENLQFEQAQKVKNQIGAMEQGLQRQIVETNTPHNQDVLYFGATHVLVATVRRGVLLGMSLRRLPTPGTIAERAHKYILAHYATDCPDELVVNDVAKLVHLSAQLTTINMHPVAITKAKQGLPHDLLQLCRMNYTYRIGLLASSGATD